VGQWKKDKSMIKKKETSLESHLKTHAKFLQMYASCWFWKKLLCHFKKTGSI